MGVVAALIIIFIAKIPYLTVHVLPVIFLILWPIYEWRATRPKPSPYLSRDDLEKLFDSEKEMKENRLRIEDIAIQGANLKVNKDGSYHRGNRLGKRLNQDLETLRAVRPALEESVRELRHKPAVAFQKWISVRAYRNAYRVALCGYAILLPLYFFGPLANANWQTSGGAFTALLVVTFATYWTTKIRINSSEKKTKKIVEGFAAGLHTLHDPRNFFGDDAEIDLIGRLIQKDLYVSPEPLSEDQLWKLISKTWKIAETRVKNTLQLMVDAGYIEFVNGAYSLLEPPDDIDDFDIGLREALERHCTAHYAVLRAAQRDSSVDQSKVRNLENQVIELQRTGLARGYASVVDGELVWEQSIFADLRSTGITSVPGPMIWLSREPSS
jgi:hypothetical protein